MTKTVIRDLATLRFVDIGENVVFLGLPGVGKTHLAIGLGVAAIEQRIPVIFLNASVLIERLKEAHHIGQLNRYLKKLTRPCVLIIDEIGYLPFDADAAYCFFQLISRRYETCVGKTEKVRILF
ncbi:ATP-binding protein [Methanoplanus endosymbiosus]|uniref:ATP-binding protein n=1 Tax=Methanoplanus endosymbiosus TaxID=33865 RepID=A0A9E7PMW3_9EURY|nr:ATP-binding protein [Methanoplanus endosymbiosus]UUX92237.1 ATP-binding protein [Methanoplanus endosymbiosus]